MKLRQIFLFEFIYQVRRPLPWLFFIALVVIAILFVRGNFLADAMYADFYINSPYVIAVVTVFGSLFHFVVAGAVTGEAGARDIGSGMHPLTYTAPVLKSQYLGGRFLAALALNAMILLAVPAGVMISVYTPGVDAGVIGPFRPAAYLTAYSFIALPNVFMATAVQFMWAVLSKRAIASYIGSLILFFAAYGGIFAIFFFFNSKEIAVLFDAFAQLTILDLTDKWSPIEKSMRLVEMQGQLLHSRLIWLGIGLTALSFTYYRFQFVHPASNPWWKRLFKIKSSSPARPADTDVTGSTVRIPHVDRKFGFTTYLRQTIALMWSSFKMITLSRGGFLVAGATAFLVVLILPQNMQDSMGSPLLPATMHVLSFLTTPITNPFTQWTIIPLFLIIYSGELVWRERDAGLGEITGAAPMPEWSQFMGRFLALALYILLWMAFLLIAALAVQVRMGYDHHEIGLFLKILLGLQSIEYFLFALLVLVIHTVVNQKYIGHLVSVLVYTFIVFSSAIGIEHSLLVYGSGPGWSYNDIRGFGGSLGPWLWFKIYWIAWAIFLAVIGRLFWVRGKDYTFRMRMHLARLRLTRSTAIISFAAIALILATGAYIFYNTNVLNDFNTAKKNLKYSADYEKRYAKYKNAIQPHLAGSKLHVEIYPRQKKVEISGSYQLVNSTSSVIDSIYVSTVRSIETGEITFDRPSLKVLQDDNPGFRIYTLANPLQPGDSLNLNFSVQVSRRGFSNRGNSSAVMENGTYFTNEFWLPTIGYESRRELIKPGDRRTYGLPSRTLLPTLEDAESEKDITGEELNKMAGAARIRFEAVVGTDGDQVAIAPGALQRIWIKGNRRYFHYVTDAPIGNEQAFFSAKYALFESKWKPVPGKGAISSTDSGRGVDIQIYYHPGHTANLDRIYRSVKASLDYYSREYGPYPHSYIRLVENPVRKMGAHADASTIDYGQGFALFNPVIDSNGLDFPFAIMAHEMAHQWWGGQLPYAFAEGAGLLTESPAWYSAMGVVEETYGREHLRRLLRFFRQPYPIKPIRQSVPLLRGADPYAAYRKGPFALYAMSEYMGKEKVNLAYRRLIEKHGSGAPPLPTSFDLYRELQAVTPDSLKGLLHDLFAANTFWELKTKKVSARQNTTGSWDVRLTLKARKVVVDPAGTETELTMNEWVEVGVFGQTGEGREFGEPLYFQKHLIRSGEQTINITVSKKPGDAGIDPYHLLIDTEPFNNVERVKIE